MEKYKECTFGSCLNQYPLVSNVSFTCDRCSAELDYGATIKIEGGFMCVDCGVILKERALKNRE